MRAFTFTTLCLVSYTSAATIWSRQATPPACALPCLNTGTNNVSTDNCLANDFTCLCDSHDFIQGVTNCITTRCSNAEDITTASQDLNAFCNAAGVNQDPSSVTTMTVQVTSTETGSSSSTAVPSDSSSSSSSAPNSSTATPSSSSSSSSSTSSFSSSDSTGGAGHILDLQTSSILVGALILAAAGMGL